MQFTQLNKQRATHQIKAENKKFFLLWQKEKNKEWRKVKKQSLQLNEQALCQKRWKTKDDNR